ncbi:LysR family transcriptional regulator [Actinocrispum wychmicini]|uniref:DNA-binding transcriptional LysR family regulator n=1 Tax=Actinocrispum wychmicini TaxID=1213861 RepID=A0A4R2JMI8_9PSEU|nr:LysR family transcriptional regulator [Actinocrispum wychmicini]TCO59832.1 DNA-binding transcriptional LysR family regulator [Actinocrispum wychmicini]
MELEVRHLRVICAIAETGSLTRAAAALHQTQPGLSAQLRRIETMLGGRLFERGQNGVVPTPLGELVLTRALAVLPTLDDLMNTAAVAQRSAAMPHRFRLGSVSSPLLGGLISSIRAVYPAADITSRGHHTPQPLVDDVANGRLEVAVVGDSPGYELPAPTGVVLWPVVTEPVFALLPEAHPLAAKEEVDLADLMDQDWAVPRPEDRTPEYWARAGMGTGRRMRVRYEAEGRLLVEIVRHGHAVSLVQPTFDEVPGIAVRPIAGNPIQYRQILAWHREGPLATAGDTVGRQVTEEYRQACDRNPVYRRWLVRQGR